MLRFLKEWALPLAMISGTLGYKLFIKLYFLTPYLLFVMLLLTFSKLSPRQMKPKMIHVWLLFLQIIGSIIAYFALIRFDKVVAESALVCIICPTATAAAVITGKLGGNVASITTYTLLGNIATAVAVPLVFPMIEKQPDMDFARAFSTIISRVFPLLIFPIIIAQVIRRYFDKAQLFLERHNNWAFYIWAISLTIVMAQIVSSLVSDSTNATIKIFIAIVSLVVCGLQFFVGKAIGSIYNERISSGQALGQKNTLLAIWMAHTYLNPLSSVGPGAYVVWQNLFNAWQLWKKKKNDRIINHSAN